MLSPLNICLSPNFSFKDARWDFVVYTMSGGTRLLTISSMGLSSASIATHTGHTKDGFSTTGSLFFGFLPRFAFLP